VPENALPAPCCRSGDGAGGSFPCGAPHVEGTHAVCAFGSHPCECPRLQLVPPATGAELLRDSPVTSSGRRHGSEEANGRPTKPLGSGQQKPHTHGVQAPTCRVPSCNQLLAGCTLYSQRMRCVAVYLWRQTVLAATTSRRVWRRAPASRTRSDRNTAQGVPRPPPCCRGPPCGWQSPQILPEVRAPKSATAARCEGHSQNWPVAAALACAPR
jgi:hypothetical protein